MCEREKRMRKDAELTPSKLHHLCYEAGFAWAEGEDGGKKGCYIRCECDKCEAVGVSTFVDYDALSGLSWRQISTHVIGGNHVSHVTRIVGYYSQVDHWNLSKVGELSDRRRGRYSLSDI